MHESEDLAEEQADKIVYFKALDCQYYIVPDFYHRDHITCRIGGRLVYNHAIDDWLKGV